jgi:hypothetical protein
VGRVLAAARYAALAGIELGRVVRIEELIGAQHTLAFFGGYRAEARGGPAGEAQVPVTWALLDAPPPESA